MHIPTFSYMRWTKRFAGTYRYDLTPSGAKAASLPPVEDPAAKRRVPPGDGDADLESLLGGRYGVPAAEVLAVPATTMANFLLLFQLVEPGDRVLVEHPVYEDLTGTARLVGAEVVPLMRQPEDDYRVDVDGVRSALAHGVKAVLLTDLHNPTGAHLSPGELEGLRDAARRHGATIVLDEVYRDFLPGPAGTAYEPGDPSLLVTSSLTKVYGLGALRVGWILAPEPVRERAVRLLDYLTVLLPSASAKAAERVLADPEDLREAALGVAARGRAIVSEWMEKQGGVSVPMPAAGLVCFPSFDGIEDTEPMVRWLMEERDTLLVPGKFFGDPSRVRLSFAPQPETLATGLSNLSEAIERFRSSPTRR